MSREPESKLRSKIALKYGLGRGVLLSANEVQELYRALNPLHAPAPAVHPDLSASRYWLDRFGESARGSVSWEFACSFAEEFAALLAGVPPTQDESPNDVLAGAAVAGRHEEAATADPGQPKTGPDELKAAHDEGIEKVRAFIEARIKGEPKWYELIHKPTLLAAIRDLKYSGEAPQPKGEPK